MRPSRAACLLFALCWLLSGPVIAAGPDFGQARAVVVRVCDGDTVVVECSSAVSVVAMGHGTGAKAVHGHSMTRAEVPLARLNNSPWIRVAVIDAAGRRAWSNPIWREGGRNPRTL